MLLTIDSSDLLLFLGIIWAMILLTLTIAVAYHVVIKKGEHQCNNRCPLTKKTDILLISLSTPCPTLFVNHLNNNQMKVVQFKDSDAKGQQTVATFQIPKDAAGNTPTFPNPPVAASTNEAVATAELGDVDAAAGTYKLKSKYTGVNGSADTSLTFTNADNTTAVGLLTSVITTDDVTTVGEPDVSELQPQ